MAQDFNHHLQQTLPQQLKYQHQDGRNSTPRASKFVKSAPRSHDQVGPIKLRRAIVEVPLPYAITAKIHAYLRK